MDLGLAKTVRGVITQGARGGDAGSGVATDNRAFVRKYKVAHSLNGKDWNFIMDSKTSLPKVGQGRRADEERCSCVFFFTSSVTTAVLVFLCRSLRGTHTMTPQSSGISRRQWPSISDSIQSGGLRQALGWEWRFWAVTFQVGRSAVICMTQDHFIYIYDNLLPTVFQAELFALRCNEL